MEEEKVCQVCFDFEPQAWRQSMCRNCFHALDDHAEELLAAEAEAVAKEKAVEASAKRTKKGNGEEGDYTTTNVASKFGTDLVDSKPSRWSKDLGLEYGKPSKPQQKNPSLAQDSSTSVKSPVKSSNYSSSSSPPTTYSQPKSSSVSKTRNVASKFEKKSEETAVKPVFKPLDLHGSSKSVSALTGTLSKEYGKSQTTEGSKSSTSKVSDPKSKLSSPSSKTSSSKSPTSGVDKSGKDEKGQNNGKELFSHSRSKATPFGKDLLKSTKKEAKSLVSGAEKHSEGDVSFDNTDSLSLSKSNDLTMSTPELLRSQSTSFNDNKLQSVKREDDVSSVTGGKGSPSKPSGKTIVVPTTINVGQSPLSESKTPVCSPSRHPEDLEESANANKTGRLAKLSPGTSSAQVQAGATGSPELGINFAKPATCNARITGTAPITQKDEHASKADPTTKSGSGGSASVRAREFDKGKTALSRDRDKGKGGGDVKETGDKSAADSTSTSFPIGKQTLTQAAVSSPTSKTPAPTSSPSTPSKPSSPTDNSETSLFNISKSSDATKSKDIPVGTNKGTFSPLSKFKELEKESKKKGDLVVSRLKSSSSSFSKKDGVKEKTPKVKSTVEEPAVAGTDDSNHVSDTLRKELTEKETSLQALTLRLAKMEDELKQLENEKEKLRKEEIHARQSQKDDMEKLLKELRGQLQTMHIQCDHLQTDNQSLMDKLDVQEYNVKKDQERRVKDEDNVHLEEDLEIAEQELGNVKDDNQELQRQIMEMKNEMDEMYDNFRQNEHDEFRDVQKELDMTAKNCRILQFKLRKAERRNDQVEEDRVHYEEKLRMLQNQFDSQDAKNHIHLLEEELRLAKDGSVRLHDELDIVDDKKNKALEENRHLTELLEHTDKRQFRLEMEIDKLRDLVQNLKTELREAKGGNNNNNTDGSSERKPMLVAVGKQGSKEYDVSQLMKDLCDSMERENDLKDQLKFSEEEAKMMRRRVSEMDEENENLRVQLQKMSEKASKHKKKEKERQRELEGVMRQTETMKTALLSQTGLQFMTDQPVVLSQFSQEGELADGGDLSADIIVVVGAEGSDIFEGDGTVPVSQRKDSTDEDLMNVMQMRVQLEMLEQELMMSHKKMDDLDLENENLQAEVKFLQEKLEEKTQESKDLPEPSTPDAYYEDKIKDLTQELDDLRWKLIEKDRELERLQVVQSRSSREHGKKPDRLKRSKSLDIDTDAVVHDLKRQLEMGQQDLIQLRKALEITEETCQDLKGDNEALRARTPIPSVQTDDAALENIELKAKVRSVEEENRCHLEKIRQLAESLHRLTKDTRTFESIATSPMSPGELLKELRLKEEENETMAREMKSLRVKVQEVKDQGRRSELDLLQELDMLQDKNSVMSNLLDIINERCEAAEEELELRIQDPAHSPARSASNASQVSALSDTSTGSDEVFMLHVGKEGYITRDWEAKLKVRIESLERLLAEERQKVSTAEKKLLLAGIDTLSPSVSDDVKLRMREKEMLQEELLKNQRHLHIATDQIQGLKERLHIVEEEQHRLKEDYAMLYDEIDKTEIEEIPQASSDSDKTPENSVDELPFVAKKISVVEAPEYKELKAISENQEASINGVDVSSMEAELSKYKEKARELEYKVEEINDVWKSKSTASDKEKDNLEKELGHKLYDMDVLEEKIDSLKLELRAQDKLIAEHEAELKEKDHALSRKADIMRDQEGESRKREQDQETLTNQISQRDGSIRSLNETIRIRDERLKEKDEIIFKLNVEIKELKQQTKVVNEKVQDFSSKLSEKDVMISVLRGQISPSSISGSSGLQCQTDVEKESVRLREALRQQQVELEKAADERKGLLSRVEELTCTMENAALMWNSERGTMQQEMNILEEKVRMYEAYNSEDRDETIDMLKIEAQQYFKEREALACQLGNLKLKCNAATRQHSEQTAKLQGELSDEMRSLKAEVDNNAHLNSEMEKLNRQAEMAYRLQQEERLLRAEHQSLKVRYETRIDKMNKEANKMLLSITKLQKERDLDKEIIENIQGNLGTVRERYMDELLKAEEDKAALDRQIKELEESRACVEQLQRELRGVKEKCLDHDRLRSELINKFATDRSSWEIDRANLNSQINQMDEHLSSSSQQHARSKDIQVNMGMAWEKERREQRRLLQEAHTLALDLQEQLRTRHESFAHERKELLRQLESDRITWNKDKRDTEKLVLELESAGRKMLVIQKQVKLLESRSLRDSEAWRAEKGDLLKQLAECKHAQSRDYKKLQEVMDGLTCLKDMGSRLKSQERQLETHCQGNLTDQEILTCVKEAVCQISQAAEDISTYSNPPGDVAPAQSSSSEIDVVKNQSSNNCLSRDGDVIIATDVLTSRSTVTSRIEEHSTPTSRKVTSQQAREFGRDKETERLLIQTTTTTPPSSLPLETVTTSTARSTPSYRVKALTSTCDDKDGRGQINRGAGEKTIVLSVSSVSAGQAASHPPLPQPPVPVVLRPFDPASSHRYDRPPSYTSGTRSASTSRATTPDIPDGSAAHVTMCRRTGFPNPPRSFVVPHHRSLQPSTEQQIFKGALAAALTSPDKPDITPRRPLTFTKSLSVDGPTSALEAQYYYGESGTRTTSLSANTTPTYPVTSAEICSSFANSQIPTSPTSTLSQTSQSSAVLPLSVSSSPYRDKFSPRTARRKFFEEPNLSQTSPISQQYQSWPKRSGGFPGQTLGAIPSCGHAHTKQMMDPVVVHREAEVNHDLASFRKEQYLPGLTSSTSLDEKMHHRVTTPTDTQPQSTITQSHSQTQLTMGVNAPVTQANSPTTKPMSAKEKRKFFKKSNSLDSTVGSSIAKAGVSAISPGAPSGFNPPAIFATAKGKLKSVFKRKSGENGGSKCQGPRSPSPPLFIQTEVPETFSNFGVSVSTELPVPVPHVDIAQLESHDQEEEVQVTDELLLSERSRDLTRRSEVPQPRGKWRSKSADRASTSASHIHCDVVRPGQGIWKFNETAV